MVCWPARFFRGGGGLRTYVRTMCRDLLDRWLNARFKDGAVRVPYVQGFERKMIKIRGRVLSKEEVLRQNLLPDWPESIAYQKERAKKQLRKAHELVQQAALRA